MVTRYKIQYIVGKRPAGVDDGDLPWRDIAGHVYDDEAEAWGAVDEFDAGFDHRYTHRATPVQIVDEPCLEPEPAPKPVRKAAVIRQLREHRAQEAFSRNVVQLEEGIRLGRDRAHLDALVELCATYLSDAGDSVLTRRWTSKLDILRALVDKAPKLRLVK